MEEVVYLEGNVKYPREYELKKGMRIKDIIPSFDYLFLNHIYPRLRLSDLYPLISILKL